MRKKSNGFGSVGLLSLALALALGCSDDSGTTKLDKGTIADQNTKKDGMTADQKITADQKTTVDQAKTADQKATVDGSGSAEASTTACTTCHGFPPTTGKHAKHVAKGYSCATCHAKTVDSKNTIISTTFHKNGTKDVSGTFTWDSSTKGCSNIGCHSSKTW